MNDITTSPSSSNPTIPLISIGVHRLPSLNNLLTQHNTPYRVVAFLDFDPATTPPAYQYTPHNLAVLLYSLQPRPQALLTGTAVLHVEGQERIVEKVRAVWSQYTEDVLRKEEHGMGCYVPLSDFHSGMEPPPPGTMEYAIRRLDEVFRPEVKYE